ncbi:hypothetical protein COLO4_27191 [Corchorus olitorius]|uniref:Uncharacterized protein n=1 Tax=Corchorus olitorius TaxID=93759 RepID=A0A1R3HSA5_9ROSI|nr:hypothetical protein COLO4_27191 [Corchorus olitorius]
MDGAIEKMDNAIDGAIEKMDGAIDVTEDKVCQKLFFSLML